jgi:hypothetical protein
MADSTTAEVDELNAQIESFLEQNPSNDDGEEENPPDQAAAKPAKAEAKQEDEAPEEEPEEQAAKAPGGDLEKARKLVDEGDLDGALQELFGKKASEFNVNSKQWEAFRKKSLATKKQFDQREREIQATYQQLEQNAERVVQRYSKYADAHKAFTEGDYSKAFSLAFDTDINEFQRRALRQKMGEDPRVSKLERELESLRREKVEQEEQRRQQQQQQQVEQQRQAFVEQVRGALEQSDHPQIARIASKPAFVRRVFEVLQEHYDPEANITLPVSRAAEVAFEDIYGDVLDSPTGRLDSEDGATRARIPAEAGARSVPKTLKRSGAVEASSPGRPLDDDELFAKYDKLLKRAG